MEQLLGNYIPLGAVNEPPSVFFTFIGLFNDRVSKIMMNCRWIEEDELQGRDRSIES
jgi:hypothetical protein